MFFLQAAATRAAGGIETAVRHYGRMCNAVGARSLTFYRGPIADVLQADGIELIAFRSTSILRVSTLLPFLSKYRGQIRAQAKGQPIVAIIHSDLMLAPLRRLVPEAITIAICHSDRVDRKAKADLILTLNVRQHEIALRELPNRSRDIHLLGNPFVDPSIEPCDDVSVAPARRFVFCGRFVELKNPLGLLRAYALTGGHMPPLAFYGDGPLLPVAQAFAKKHGIAATFAGWANDPWEAITPDDILVVPSIWEGLPYLVQEALARGIPIVASNIAGNRAALGDGACGDLYALDNDKDLADRLRLAASDPVRLRRMSQASASAIQERYGAYRFHSRLAELVGDSFAQRRAGR